jgi:hypothetical protein
MEHNASAKNKAGSNAVTTHLDTNRNIPGGFFSLQFFCIALTPLLTELIVNIKCTELRGK